VGWYDDWVLTERERLRHRRVRALETLAAVSLDAGRSAESISFAEEAAKLEPLLESAVTLHVRALLHDGDLTAALAEYRAFRQRLDAELGVTPPRALTHLLREAKAQRLAVGEPAATRIVPRIAPARHGRRDP
jgi:DNA-binding SARP family transcriptional activator